MSSRIQQIPLEIWQEIFMFACLSEDYSFDTPDPSTEAESERITCLPYDITLVCSRWRKVASSLPCLWTAISVDLYGVSQDVRPILRTYLRNARDRPLKIRLSRLFQSKPHQIQFKDNAMHAYNYLLRNIDKCWDLTLTHCGSFSPDVPDDALPNMDDGFPSLRVLEIDLNTDESEILEIYLRNALQYTPILTTLKIGGVFPEVPVYPFDQLTQLNISKLKYCTIDILRTWLPLCTNLRVLFLPDVLYENDSDRPYNNQYNQKPMPSLADLIVNIDEYPDDIYPFFSVFQFPSLSKLCMRISGDFAPGDGWPLFFLEALRSSCQSLKKLGLIMDQSNDLTEDAFPVSDILVVMPNLTSLDFTFQPPIPSTSSRPLTSKNSLSCQILRALTVGHTAPEDMFENGSLNEEAWRSHIAQNPSALLPKLNSLQLQDENISEDS
ncbi:hypothetical protein AAF712_007204 [Marasmius tenuissimus]|uniref:F-box domain-containing protein n=1 Tax=Marasmius tenuissimus TaxID=585030 RepID=A0ABR2ZVG2_9AGAR